MGIFYRLPLNWLGNKTGNKGKVFNRMEIGKPLVAWPEFFIDHVVNNDCPKIPLISHSQILGFSMILKNNNNNKIILAPPRHMKRRHFFHGTFTIINTELKIRKSWPSSLSLFVALFLLCPWKKHAPKEQKNGKLWAEQKWRGSANSPQLHRSLEPRHSTIRCSFETGSFHFNQQPKIKIKNR